MQTVFKTPTIGKLRHRIHIRQRVDLPAADMGIDQTFPYDRPRWARIEPVGGAIYAGTAQTDRAITHRIFMRYLPGIHSGSQEVVHRDTVYRIRRVADLKGESRFSILDVEEIGNGQASHVSAY